MGPSEQDTAYVRVTPVPTKGNAQYYGETPEPGSSRMLVECEHTLFPEYKGDRRYLSAVDAWTDALSQADLGYVSQPPANCIFTVSLQAEEAHSS